MPGTVGTPRSETAVFAEILSPITSIARDEGMTKLLFDNGVWAMFAGFDRSVLQVKPGLLMGQADIDAVMAAFDRACAAAVAL